MIILLMSQSLSQVSGRVFELLPDGKIRVLMKDGSSKVYDDLHEALLYKIKN